MKIKKGGIMIILSLFLVAFFALILLIQIRYYMSYWKVAKEFDDLVTYGDPIANGIRSEIEFINELAKGEFQIEPQDQQAIDSIFIKINNEQSEIKEYDFFITSIIRTEIIKGSKVEYKEGKLRIKLTKEDNQERIIGTNDDRKIQNLEKDSNNWIYLQTRIGQMKSNGNIIINRIKRENMEEVKRTSEEYLKGIIYGKFERRERVEEVKVEINKWIEGIDIDGDNIPDPDTYKHIIEGEFKIRVSEKRTLQIPFTLAAKYKLEYLTLFQSKYSMDSINPEKIRLKIKVSGYPILRLINLSIDPNE